MLRDRALERRYAPAAMQDQSPTAAGTPVVSVVTPTFNEAENLPLLVASLQESLAGLPHEIIVADDDSPDGTWEIAERLGEADPSVRLVRRFHDHGLSAAVLDGMSVARGRVLAVIDADLQHDPAILPDMVAALDDGRADVVVGSRATEGGGYGDWAASRRLVSWVATFIARVVLRVSVSDPMSGYFALTRSAYERGAAGINPRGFKILLEFIGRDRDLRVLEVPYEFRNRVHGETKLNRSVIRSYLLAVAELRLGRQVDPAFLLYVLVGLVGLVVNSVVFSLAEAAGVPQFTTGLNEALDPIYGSFVLSVAVSTVVVFALNNEFTFWEQRYSGWKLMPAFLVFVGMTIVGTLVHVGVFTYLQNIGLLLSVLGDAGARTLHNLIGAVVALIVNWYLNTTYLWRRRNR
ncbi:MAG: glycosyltransferase [Microthrixaceae bacterium]|jgi:dolichol-phosphate mannosyltransferase